MTAFLSLESTDHYALRWFSPECEEAFCGHAILASAHFLLPAVDPGTPPANITFRSKAGQLRARRTVMGAVELDFPAGDARPTTTEELQQVKELLKQAMGDQATVVKADLGPLDVYIELKMAEGLHLRDAIIAQQPFVCPLNSLRCCSVLLIPSFLKSHTAYAHVGRCSLPSSVPLCPTPQMHRTFTLALLFPSQAEAQRTLSAPRRIALLGRYTPHALAPRMCKCGPRRARRGGAVPLALPGMVRKGRLAGG